MAELTGRRKACRRMVRVCGLFIVAAMTAITILRCSGINAVFMAGRAGQRGMDALPEKDAVMVEGSLVPAGVGRQMAELASRRETRPGMVGLLRFLITLSVAGIAVEGGQTEVSVFVAIVTAQVAVSGVERHPRPGAVVPACGGPGDRTVAVLAIGAQHRPVAVVLASNPMAVIAAHGCPFVDTVQMAGGAGNIEVASLERKSSRLVKTTGG